MLRRFGGGGVEATLQIWVDTPQEANKHLYRGIGLSQVSAYIYCHRIFGISFHVYNGPWIEWIGAE